MRCSAPGLSASIAGSNVQLTLATALQLAERRHDTVTAGRILN